LSSVYTEPDIDDCSCSTAEEFKKRFAGVEPEGPEGLMVGSGKD
jgi:hypothetical protein